MCGIVGYTGWRQAEQVIINGLRRMEYRGYDSAGIAVVADGAIAFRKQAGKLANLEAELARRPLPSSHHGIGHTRWATHGAPTDANAHPHLSFDSRLAVVHNGIIENFAVLKAELEAQGIVFQSQTDSECAAHLLALTLAEIDAQAAEGRPGSGSGDGSTAGDGAGSGDGPTAGDGAGSVAPGSESGDGLVEALRQVCGRLEGAFTLVVLDALNPGRIVAGRRNSPLVVGLGQGENFLASDVASFIEYTDQAVELGQDQIVEITADRVSVTSFDGSEAVVKPYRIEWDLSAAEKGGYDWFMRKEIYEQPRAAADTLLGRISPDGELVLDEMRIDKAVLRSVDKVIIVACGTAYHAGLIAKYAIEHWTRIPCEVEIASEFRYRDPIITATTLVVTISQSGETADTLMAIRHAREQHAPVVAICNTNGSTIPRESDAVIYTHAGPEIGVASTKGFTTQIIACYLLGLYLAQERGVKFGDEVLALVGELTQIPAKMERVLDQLEQIADLAREHVNVKSVLFIGRHVGYPVALEGALKLKEISYLHAEGFAAGELKHGPIALIEDGLPVFVVVPPQGRDQLHDKVISNIQEVRARGAKTIVLAEDGDLAAQPFADYIISLPVVPTLFQPLVAIIPLQYFACEVATLKGFDVDQPRNLAKSVTVE